MTISALHFLVYDRQIVSYTHSSMSASLANLPTEIINILIKEYNCYILRCISKRLYSIAIDIIYTGKLYSPKTPTNNDSTLMSVQSYLQFLQRTPGMAYAEPIK